MTRLIAIVLLTLPAGVSDILGAGAGTRWTGWPHQDRRAIEERRVERVPLESRIFGNARTLRVWLPPGYDHGVRAGRVYPVLYLNDGQSLFAGSEKEPATGATWQAGVTALELIGSRRIEPIVIVGIDNAGAARAREYLPWPDTFLDPPEPEPRGQQYVDFLRYEVIPAIEARFRVRRDPAGRALGGASYGALAAAYVAAADDGLFDRLLLESPSFYVDDGHIFRFLADSGHTLRRVYLGVGTNELALEECGDHAWNRKAVGDVRRMAALVAETARGDPPQVEVVEEECAVHSEAAWAHRLPHALEILFSR